MRLHIHLFDHPRVTDGAGGPPRALRSRAQRLLAYLVLNRERQLPREHVAFTLWPDGPEPWALGMLRRALSDLRAALPPSDDADWVNVTDTTIRWNTGAPAWIDVQTFEQAIASGTPADLHRAIDLYNGELLAGWEDEWVLAERERLRELYIDALRRLVAHHRALGRLEPALDLARRAVASDPLSEAAQRDLISLLYESGDRAAALAAYSHLTALLDEELGVEPMPETEELHAAIVEGRTLPVGPDQVSRPTAPEKTGPRPQPLVGRDAEMGRLRPIWERARAGHGGLVTVGGEAGVGKSHLIRALTDIVVSGGGMALAGHCYEFEQALPYHAIVEMLRPVSPLLRHSGLPVAHRVALARLAPDLLGTAGPAEDSADMLTADPRAQLFEALWQAFLALARDQPLLLVLEDAHWAAESVIDWLTYITPRLGTTPILIVVTYRTDELDAVRPLARLNRRLARSGGVESLMLKRLTPTAHRELVMHLSSLPEGIAGPLAARLYEETAGNPFFLQEIVRGLVETGQITVRDERWEGEFVDSRARADLPLPDTVRDLIEARVERLTMESRTFIQVAAVTGRVFQYDVIQRAIGWEDEPALEALETVLARGLVDQHDGPDRFTFSHHLIQEVIYAAMTAPRRTYWHRHLARAIESLRPDDVEALAHHFGRAGDHDRARIYYARAGDHAYQLAALDDAAHNYRAALDRWPAEDISGRAELLYKLGQCQWVLSELHAALGTFDGARRLFESLGNTLRVGDVERTIGRIYWELNDRRASLDHYHRALDVLEREPESVELARAISSISQMHMLASEYREARAWGARALAMAVRLGAEDVAVHAQTNIGLSLVSSEDVEESLTLLRDSLQRALAANLVHDTMRIYVGLGEQLLSFGRYPDARATYRDLLDYAGRVQSGLFTGVALRNLIQVEWLTGRWSEALDDRQQLLAWLELGTQPHLATLWAARVLGTLHNDLGQPDLALQVLEGAVDSARDAAELQTTVPHLAEFGRALAALGRPSDAAAAFQEVLGWVARFPYISFDCISPLLMTCRWFTSQADSPDNGFVQDALAWLRRAASEVGTLEMKAALAEASGLAMHAAGDPAGSSDQLVAAVEDWSSLGRPFDQMRALGTLSTALRGAGHPREAATALDQALALRDILAARLPDPRLRSAFLDSPHVRELHAG